MKLLCSEICLRCMKGLILFHIKQSEIFHTVGISYCVSNISLLQTDFFGLFFFFGFVYANPMLAAVCDILLDINKI